MTASSRLGALFVAAGLAATAAQVLLLRELLVAAAGDEASVGTGLAAWLAGIAAGAAAARRLPDRSAPRVAGLCLALLASAGGGGIVAGRLLRLAWAPPAGELPGLGLVLALALVLLLPVGGLVGAAFTSLAAAAARSLPAGEAISRLYVAESAGSLLAGAAVTLAVGTLVAPLPAALGAGLASVLLALPAAGAGIVGARPLLAAAGAVLAGALAVSAPLDRATERTRFAGTAPGVPFVAACDTPARHLDVGGTGVLSLYASGQYAGSFPDPFASEAAAHTLASLARRPERVLSLGGLERGALGFLLSHPVRRVVVVEGDPLALRFVERFLPGADRRALADPRVTVVADDPRRFLGGPSGSFDLIALPPGEPVTLLSARLTTVELFRLCAARLSHDGVLVVPVRTAPAVLTGETASLAGSVWGALRAVFPVVRATPGPESLFVAGYDPAAVTLDPGVLAARWRERGVTSPSFAPELFGVLFPPGRVAALEEALDGAARLVPPSRDDRPVSFLFALARRQRETASRAGQLLAALGKLPPPALVLLALAPSLLSAAWALRRRPALGAAARASVAATGAAGMAWSILVLFGYQTRAGALYGRLGLLTALFMLGLVVGAALARHLLRRCSPRPRTALCAALGLAVAAGAVVSAALPALARLPADLALAGLPAHGALLFASGLATGALFPAAAHALLASGAAAGEAAGRLETADHAGAAAAALVSAVVLVPALGLAATAWLATALVALALVVAWRSEPA